MNDFKIGDLHVRRPIIQGGMGVAISLSGLASAVANQGGIGVISAVGIGMTEPDYVKNFKKANLRALKKEIQKARSKTDGVIGVNIMMAVTDFEDLLNISIDEKVDVIFIGAGLPLHLPGCLTEDCRQNLKSKIIPKVSSAKAVGLILKYWDRKYNHVPDGFVIEGPLAGGHLGFSKTELEGGIDNLENMIANAVELVKPYEDKFGRNIPIIAAGGIYNGKDIYNIMNTGASAVKMGTRFVTTYECDASIKFKESYINSVKEDITIIKSPVGLPGRAIRNQYLNEVEAGDQKPFRCNWRCLKTCDYTKVPYCIAGALFSAAQGKMTEGFSFAGAKAYLADRLISVSDLFDELVSEYDLAALES